MSEEQDNPIIEVRVEGNLLGTIDPYKLKGKAQFELERCNTALQLLTWLETYADGDAEEAERVLSELSLQDIMTFARELATAMGQALRAPKAKGAHSGQPSRVERGRRTGRA